MKEERFGFVYIWRDRKHNRYYVGSHWGSESDSYICSSRWMKGTYKRRPKDFKRKILEKCFCDRDTLLDREHAWLSLIKSEELGSKYYNLRNHRFGHWSTDIASNKSVGQKISAAKKGKSTTMSEEDRVERGKTISEVKKAKSKERTAHITVDMLRNDFFSGLILKQVAAKYDVGLPTIRKIALDAGYASLREIQPKRKVVHSEETRMKISQMTRGKPKNTSLST